MIPFQFLFFDTNILGYRIKFFAELNRSVYNAEDLKDLYPCFLLHTFKVTTSKSVLRNLLLETVANFGQGMTRNNEI